MIEPNYYRLANAAEKIGCTEGYLIDLGAEGLLRMFATLSYHYPDWIDYADYGMEGDKVELSPLDIQGYRRYGDEQDPKAKQKYLKAVARLQEIFQPPLDASNLHTNEERAQQMYPNDAEKRKRYLAWLQTLERERSKKPAFGVQKTAPLDDRDLFILAEDVGRLSAGEPTDAREIDTVQNNETLDARLEKIREFMAFLAQLAGKKGIEFDAMDLPFTKSQLLTELKKRYPKNFKIKQDAFEAVWTAGVRSGICASKRANLKNGESFLKSVFG